MMIIRTLLFAASAYWIAGCATPAPSGAEHDAAQIATGQQLAETHCSSCHAIGATGESRHSMAPPFRTLSRAYPVNMLEEAFAEGILVGHRDMPEFRLEPAQIDALVGFLESIQERRGA